MSPRILRHFVLATVLLGLVASSASAQYFGRNKVQYQDLKFSVLKTDHFDIYYYPEEQAGVEITARLAERWLVRLERMFDHKLNGRQPLVLYGSHPAFEQTNVIRGELGEGTGGVTEPVRRRIVMPLAGPIADTDHVLGHELVHAFQFDITARSDAPARTGAATLPLWFIEGMAEYLSLGSVDPNTAMWMRDAVREAGERNGEKLPDVDDLDSPKFFPYRWGQAFWSYVAGRYGDRVVGRMLVLAAAAGDYKLAINRVLGTDEDTLSKDWHEALRSTFQPVLDRTTTAASVGRAIIPATDLGSANIGPSLSPDGRRIAFLSTRSIFSTDLFIADATTGRILHRLTKTATDPHFSSLQFIYSSGGWDADGKRLAAATVVNGRAALAIFDTTSGAKTREVPLNEVDEIFNPTWAPDGHAVAFTGLSQGLMDLYTYDLGASKLTRLTNDAFAEVQPAWSPDGKRIAFSSDRFTSHLDTLDMRDFRLGLIDPETHEIQPVSMELEGQHLNPQWMPDSGVLAFMADPDGISNVYRVTLSTGTVERLTNVSAGISGITRTSPALSVAAQAGTIAVAAYEDNKYSIYRVNDDRPRNIVNGPGTTTPSAAALPPVARGTSEVATLIANPILGLPADTREYESEAYKAKFGLEAVMQPNVSAGVSQFGASVGGGIGFQFSDALNTQTLMVAAQVEAGIGGNYSFKNTAAQLAYLNEAHRWNWGLGVSQFPYLSGGFLIGNDKVKGQDAYVEKSILYRQTEQSVSAVTAYPFSRVQRLELQAAATHYSFDQIVQTRAYSLATGELIQNDSTTTELERPLSLFTPSAALVRDTSNFGATSPVQGMRYRFEASPALGDIKYAGLLADYRRYVMPVSFYTIAARVLHYGRYGSGAEDARLFPLFLGYPSLVRGYGVGSFDSRDCVASATSSCPAFDELIGSRLLVGNLEFRFPLLRPFGVSGRMYGPLPMEVALFADGGVAWNGGQSPSILGGSKDGVSSAGAALRVNFFGIVVGEFNFVKPFQRESRGWMFQFNLAPGF